MTFYGISFHFARTSLQNMSIDLNRYSMECNKLCAEKELPRRQRELGRALRVDVRLISRYS